VRVECVWSACRVRGRRAECVGVRVERGECGVECGEYLESFWTPKTEQMLLNGSREPAKSGFCSNISAITHPIAQIYTHIQISLLEGMRKLRNREARKARARKAKASACEDVCGYQQPSN
jgi:hypothetical protein